ncbi:MAG: hypothetical protein AABZ77_05190 [Chloroflexota bacterium]
MPKRIKKPTVKPETRLEWLRRHEGGESQSHIAETAEFDIRTVRKHIDLARMERDVNQARTEVLRNALTGHYDDLLKTAEAIEKSISGREAVSLGKEQPLMEGLRQHMPRSPLWENLRKWNRTLSEIADLEEAIRQKIKTLIEADGRLTGIVSQNADELIPTAIGALTEQVKAWSQGYERLNIDRDIRLKGLVEDKVELSYGSHGFGELENRETVKRIVDAVRDFETVLKDSAERAELEKLYNRLQRLDQSSREVLTVVRLRRIVPGRCLYCPI